MLLFKNVLTNLRINMSPSFHAHCSSTKDPLNQVQQFSKRLLVLKENRIYLNSGMQIACKSESI